MKGIALDLTVPVPQAAFLLVKRHLDLDLGYNLDLHRSM